jgi:predicted GH43/DUF377 family glycosyl hydrolase
MCAEQKLVLFLGVVTLAALGLRESRAQTQLERWDSNPVVGMAAPDEWDQFSYSPCVTREKFEGRDVYRMWYQGWDGEGSAIGYAESEDGLSWEKEPLPVLERGAAGSWDDCLVGTPAVIRRTAEGATRYEMWYSAVTSRDGCESWHIQRAESPDGIHGWEKNPVEPVLRRGTGGWDRAAVLAPAVIFDEAEQTYRMWFQGYDGNRRAIGLATSRDGVLWGKDGGNPVLAPAGVEESTINPAVIFRRGTYEMWYSAWRGTAFHLGYARSEDGAVWTRFERNPVLSPGADWELAGVFNAAVLVDTDAVLLQEQGEVYKMWYTGTRSSESPWHIGYAEAPWTVARPADFRRGDANQDGTTDISDSVFVLNHLFLGGPAPLCPDAADANDDGAQDISDGIYSLRFLFGGGPPPPEPFGACGPDSTRDQLDECSMFSPCD